jgi:hypothetical protein
MTSTAMQGGVGMAKILERFLLKRGRCMDRTFGCSVPLSFGNIQRAMLMMLTMMASIAAYSLCLLIQAMTFMAFPPGTAVPLRLLPRVAIEKC